MQRCFSICPYHSPETPHLVCPDDAKADPFLYLPPAIPFTAQMQQLAQRYLAHEFDWAYYPAFQAAAFLQPASTEQHAERRHTFQQLKSSAEQQGFTIPEAVTRLQMTDEYIDRLHHNCIWPRLPAEWVRYPERPDLAMFLLFSEGQGCGHWHLLLAPDGSHTVVCAEEAFGVRSVFPDRTIANFSRHEVFHCADDVNEWLYHYFIDSAEHDQQYVERLNAYFERDAS